MLRKLLFNALICFLFSTGVALAAQTSTTSYDEVSRSITEITVVQTATAADEVACVDTREADLVCYFANTGGTGINVDIDRFWDDTTTYDGTVNSGAVNEDITQAADESGCEAVISPYYCYDVDSSSSGTLSLTWLIIKREGE